MKGDCLKVNKKKDGNKTKADSLVFLFVLIPFVFLFLFAGCSNSSTIGDSLDTDQVITLTAASSWAENDDQNNTGFWWLQEKVNKLSDGRIVIKWVGGPETFPAFELGEAVRDGAVDIGWLSPAYYASAMPEGLVMEYSELTFQEERDSQALDYLNSIHRNKMNSIIFSSADGGKKYSIYTKKPVHSLDDFKGMRIRVSESYLPLIRALEAETILLPGGEIYTAMERGVIDGFTWPYLGITAFSLEELTKYKIQPYYWRVSVVGIINIDTWDALPEWAQNIIDKAAREIEAELPDFYKEFEEKENAILKSNGIEFLTLDDGDEFLEIAKKAGWERLREVVKDGNVEELISKFSR